MSYPLFLNPVLAGAIPHKYYDGARSFLEGLPKELNKLLKDPTVTSEFIQDVIKDNGPFSKTRSLRIETSDFRQIAFHALLDGIKDPKVDFNGILKANNVIFSEFLTSGNCTQLLQSKQDAILARLTLEIRNENPEQPSPIAELLINKFQLQKEAAGIRNSIPKTVASPNVGAEARVRFGLTPT